jgi:acyl-[acyl carrier protein]--UDP-N-acetylglucosamine O-acyltransferase
LKEAYRILFRARLALADALAEMMKLDDANVQHLVNFIRDSQRGFTRAARAGQTSAEE